MKTIGLLSDTHGYLDDAVFTHFADCDEIWHAGDVGTIAQADTLAAFKPLRCVYGNIDGQDVRIVHPEHQFFEVEGVNVWMTHIGGYPGRYPAKIKETLLHFKPDLFICGHSHITLVQMDQKFNMLWMNPGACGFKGFHTVKTIVRFCITEDRIHDLELIELGKRV